MPPRTVRANGKDVDVGEFDRMDFLPYHEGPNVLPHDLLFHTLHALATADGRLAVVDCKAGYEATYQQLLSDIVLCRNKLRETLDKESLEALRNEKEVSLVLWSSGYEFTVAFFAILALGAIAVPLSMCISHCACRIFHSPSCLCFLVFNQL
jgi:malonyl-CoA/methylmalonyl-CoA synthetase